MINKMALIFFVCFLFLQAVASGQASVEISSSKMFLVEKSPLDVAVSLDGRWIFVLTDKREILVYSSDGRLEDRLEIAGPVEEIRVGAREDMLYLISRKTNTVRILNLDFIHRIDISESPVKGDPGAPVVIAVFSDFQ